MSKKNPAGYVALNESGELAERIDRAYELLHSCRVCPRKCGANRIMMSGAFAKPLSCRSYRVMVMQGTKVEL
jgi:uncharacterized Fe-S radical SAM superfamily protein PflX